MSFTFTPKQTAPTTAFSFGTPSGDSKTIGAAKPVATSQPNFGFGSGAGGGSSNKLLTATPPPTFNLGTATSTPAATQSALSYSLGHTTSAPAFNLSGATSTPAPVSTGFALGATGATPAVAPTTGFSIGTASLPTSTPATGFATQAKIGVAAPTTAATALNFNAASTAVTPPPTSTTAAVSLGSFSLAGATAAKQSFGGTTTVASSTAATLGATLATASLPTTTLATSVPPTTTLTFTQLEDSINKWTINLEDQGKLFANQAKQLNAWDRLLISNGEKVLSLNSGIERVKQQQQQLDQELDFVLAQQKELEDLIAPLEKDLQQVPITDMDRHHTYQLAENLDTQLKQMSEDLKEVIEQLNESTKTQEMTNPIAQIGKILNAHMNSLQWIDRNTTKITTQLDQISKMQDLNRRQNEKTLMGTYE